MVITRRKLQRLFGLLLSILLLLSLLPSVSAEDSVPEQGSLTVRLTHIYTSDGQKRSLPNVEVSLYLVASMESEGLFTASDVFQSFEDDLQEKQTQETWEALIPKLESWVQSNAVSASVCLYSGADGLARFEKLVPGLYLAVFGEGIHPEQPATRVGFQSALLCVPYRGEEGDHMQDLEDPDVWDYDYAALPKSFESHLLDRIQKIWKDNQDAKKLRPRELNVEIQYEDGTVQSLSLNAENGWLLEFTPASKSAVLEIREPNLPEAYFYRGFECVGTTIQFTNELSTPGNENPTPTNPGSDSKPGLPHTGQLWWPVPVLLVSGLVLILLGVLRQRGRKNNG